MTDKYKGNIHFHDMEKINRLRDEEKSSKEAELNDRKEKVLSLEATWALARLCKVILKENESDWDDRRDEIRKNLEECEENVERKERFGKAEKKKNEIKRKQTQSRIDLMLTELSKKGAEEWKSIESEEEKLERLEMKEMKENIWRWRSTNQQKVKKQAEKENKKQTLEDKLKRVKEILEREKLHKKIEKEKRKKKQLEKEKEWLTRREEKELERKERKERQRKCEETWITLRWAIKTLEETEEEWKIDLKERKKVTRKERRKKYKKKELFKRIIAEVREKVDKIEESEEPEVDKTSSEDFSTLHTIRLTIRLTI